MILPDDKAERAGDPSNAELAEQLLRFADDISVMDLDDSADLVRLAAQRLKARSEISEALRNLSVAEATYRATHDLEGDASPKTGRAWDLMRRAGDKARAALEARSEISEGEEFQMM